MKSVVIYTYFSSPSSNYNLNFFVKKELTFRESIDYIIVINGYKCNVKIPKLNNVTLLQRKNVGYDFGGHCYALKYIKTNKKKYDYYFFMNSGVIGPIMPNYFKNHWTTIFIEKINDKIKLVGTTIVCLPKEDAGGYGPKVEGFFFMVDKIGLELLQKENIFYYHKDKYDTIINGEYGLSRCILNNGYSIDCMLPEYQNIDWRDSRNYHLNDNLHPSRKNSFFGKSINPYDVIFHKWYWRDEKPVNINIVKKYVCNFIINYKKKDIVQTDSLLQLLNLPDEDVDPTQIWDPTELFEQIHDPTELETFEESFVESFEDDSQQPKETCENTEQTYILNFETLDMKEIILESDILEYEIINIGSEIESEIINIGPDINIKSEIINIGISEQYNFVEADMETIEYINNKYHKDIHLLNNIVKVES